MNIIKIKILFNIGGSILKEKYLSLEEDGHLQLFTTVLSKVAFEFFQIKMWLFKISFSE